MTEIFIDVGNSRIKFALADEHGFDYLGAFALDAFNSVDALETLLHELDVSPDKVFVASVASAQFEHDLREAISTVWRDYPVFLTTQIACCGLQNGYDDPLQLGVDRWLAMLGVRALTQKDFIVIDAGTAITVDAVSNDKHLGGFILPGLGKMRESLALGTAKVKFNCSHAEASVSEEEAATSFFATNTQDAVCGGTLYMAASALSHLLIEAQVALNGSAKVYMTGGDATLLRHILDDKIEVVPDLVLRGMWAVTENLKK